MKIGRIPIRETGIALQGSHEAIGRNRRIQFIHMGHDRPGSDNFLYPMHIRQGVYQTIHIGAANTAHTTEWEASGCRMQISNDSNVVLVARACSNSCATSDEL
eukprot:scaffold25842_cov198-Amphora_coffeaeformis.AAC.22